MAERHIEAVTSQYRLLKQARVEILLLITRVSDQRTSPEWMPLCFPDLALAPNTVFARNGPMMLFVLSLTSVKTNIAL